MAAATHSRSQSGPAWMYQTSRKPSKRSPSPPQITLYLIAVTSVFLDNGRARPPLTKHQQINTLSPSMGFVYFTAILLLAGDVETNPGPPPMDAVSAAILATIGAVYRVTAAANMDTTAAANMDTTVAAPRPTIAAAHRPTIAAAHRPTIAAAHRPTIAAALPNLDTIATNLDTIAATHLATTAAHLATTDAAHLATTDAAHLATTDAAHLATTDAAHLATTTANLPSTAANMVTIGAAYLVAGAARLVVAAVRLVCGFGLGSCGPKAPGRRRGSGFTCGSAPSTCCPTIGHTLRIETPGHQRRNDETSSRYQQRSTDFRR
ncbi:unnamed protein product [Leuciscus chuanchicus]